MDTEQEDTRLAELREALKRTTTSTVTVEPRTFEIKSTMSPEQLSLDLSDLTIDRLSPWTADQIPCLTTDQISVLDLSSLSINHPNNTVYTTPGTTPSWSFSDLSTDHRSSGKIALTGEDADIEINGESVVGMLRDIRDQLAILRVSEEMEAEWDDLRELRQQYEAKLAECREKSAAWKSLKSG